MIADNLRIQRWIQETHKKTNAIPSVTNAIFGNTKLNYMFYRVRYILFSALLIAMIHSLEIIILSMDNSYIIRDVFAIKILIISIEAFWWGYCEVLRERIRRLKILNYVATIIDERHVWSNFSIILGIGIGLILVVISYYVSFNDLSDLKARIFYLSYIAIIVVEFAFAFHLKTLNSSILGIQRIYKPAWAILSPTIVRLTIMLALYKYLGRNSILIAQLVSSLFIISFGYIFTFFCLKRLNQEFKIQFKPPFIQSFKRIISGEALLASLSLLSIQVQNLLLLTLVIWSFGAHIQILYIITPLLQVCYNWPKALYFDLKRFNTGWEHKIFKPMLNFCYAFTGVLSIGLWLISLIVIHYFYFDWAVVIFLFIIFMLTGILSIQQMVIFARHKYFLLIIQTIILNLLIFLLLGFLELSIIWELICLISGFIISLIFLQFNLPFPTIIDNAIPRTPFITWIDFYHHITQHERLTNTIANKVDKDPYTIIEIQLIARTKLKTITKIALTLKTYDPEYVILRNTNNSILVACRDYLAIERLLPELIIAASGRISKVAVKDLPKLLKLFEDKLAINPELKFTTKLGQLFLNGGKPDKLKFPSLGYLLVQNKLRESLYQLQTNNLLRIGDTTYIFTPIFSPQEYVTAIYLDSRPVGG